MPTPATRPGNRGRASARCACSSTARRHRPGPGQVINQIQNSTARSQNAAEPLNLAQYITQNSGSGKTLTFGNLLAFPLQGRMFYVQPLYVQASAGSGSFPQNKVTVAVYGTNVAWGDTLEQAINGLFGEGDAGSRRPSPARRPTPRTPPTGTLAQQLAAALGDVQAAYTAGQDALKKGDFAAYGTAQKDLDAAIKTGELARRPARSPRRRPRRRARRRARPRAPRPRASGTRAALHGAAPADLARGGPVA